MINEEQVTIVVSPNHFKSLTLHLELALRQYEEINGEIKVAEPISQLPPDALPKLKALLENIREKALASSASKPTEAASASNEPPPPEKRSRGARKKKGS
jgi:hypothetical protein